MKIAIVTPTRNSEHLEQCVHSVRQQTYENVVHYLVADGNDVKIPNYMLYYKHTRYIMLDDNVGANGWYGHRVYAAAGFLVNADVICYLDEDNWLEPNHCEAIVKTLEDGNEWCYSLRNICDEQGEFLMQDNAESLGKWPCAHNPDLNHIDTSCFAVRQHVAAAVGGFWYGQWGADRQFYGALQQHFPRYDCTMEHSVNYRLAGNKGSVDTKIFDMNPTYLQDLIAQEKKAK